ncbi:MAG: hypothetical protein CMJ64_01900 [Planctomycetaceae bacterium]|nr:hypothetical protein [Planctomycetaceae bacterium]
MSAPLTKTPNAGYRFLRGIEPYSSGVTAEPGWEIVHVTLARPLPWYEGMVAARRFVEQKDRERHSLCGFELRCAEPFSMEGFIAFNREYRALLEEWEMLVEDQNPVARTNVSPVESPSSGSMLYGFSYTEPSDLMRPTFVVAGGGELRGPLDSKQIVRVGETSEEAMLEKARCVVEIMCERLAALGNNDLLTTINVYTAHPLRKLLAEVVIPGIPAAARLGVRWFYSRPPVKDIEFEMDMRGVARDLVVELAGCTLIDSCGSS